MRALDLWVKRLHSGWQGQRVSSPSTWVLDGLWKAACYEVSATEAEGRGQLEAAALQRKLAEQALTVES